MLRRDTLGLLGLFLALALCIGFGARNGDGGLSSSPTSHASGQAGALALYSWFGELGYNVERLEYRDFAIDAEADLLFVLAPSERYTPMEAAAVVEWVEAGGTLILADDRPGQGGALLRALEASVVVAPEVVLAPLIQPALLTPPTSAIAARTGAMVGSTRADAVPLVGPATAPVLLGMQRGKGYVYLSAALHPFTNAGLAEPGSAALLLNLARRVPLGGRVLFDEYHHGFTTPPSLRTLLLGSPWGWALLYALLVGAAYLVLSGRRFGRPVPLPEERARRSSAEYLQSMAGLLRRGRKGAYVLAHYRVALKRRLARPHGLNPTLDDMEFVAALEAARPLDGAALRALLARMGSSKVGEQELLQIAAEADRY